MCLWDAVGKWVEEGFHSGLSFSSFLFKIALNEIVSL